jgi:succinoglycan biosynthesis protein ExoA
MISKVSVVIPSFNESKSIKTCIASFLNSEYPGDSLEIIVADGGSTDGTVEIIKQLAFENRNVILLNNKSKITPAGLNL